MKKQIILVLIILATLQTVYGMSKHDWLDSFSLRREAILEIASENNGIAIFHSAPIQNRNNDVDYDYRQSSNFAYLTGWDEAEAILVINPSAQSNQVITMFVLENDPQSMIWTGKRKGTEGAMSMEGIDTAFAYDEFNTKLAELLSGKQTLILDCGNDKAFQSMLFNKIDDMGKQAPQTIIKGDKFTSQMRLRKSPSEIASMQKAIDITGKSIIDMWKQVSTCQYEYEVEALIEYGFRRQGSIRNGFPCIVASGNNATVLHYETNQDIIQPNSLILADVGAEWDFYSADISRTFPANGHFTKEQAEIYQIVLDAQKQAIAVIKPGVSWREPHRIAQGAITEGLVKIGLLEGDIDSLVTARAYSEFFMHGTSHWLGLDVHDTGGYSDENNEEYKLATGMVLTVEPGIYIRKNKDIPKAYWGIGIRIEDDVLVTSKGHQVLSKNIPKEINEIENIIQQKNLNN